MLAPLLTLCALLTGCEFHSVSAIEPTGDLPPSRAGAVRAAADYEEALTLVLQAVVTDEGRVRYDRLRGDLDLDFRRVLKAVEDYDAGRLGTDAEKLAFWINAYNVQMLQHIVETPEIENIVEDGFSEVFFRKPLRTAGRALSLDQIEHEILRRQSTAAVLVALQPSRLDPRLHVGLNCAAVSCPRLRPQAYTAHRLEAMLEAGMRDFVGSPAHFRFEGDTAVLSALLDWFGADFDLPTGRAGDYLLEFMPSDRPDGDRLRSLLAGRDAATLRGLPHVRYDYDWAVNAAP